MRRSAYCPGSLLVSTVLGLLLVAPAAFADGPRRPEERSPIFRSAPEPRARRAAPEAQTPRGPDAGIDLEQLRGSPLQRRAVTLLISEIQQLESMLHTTRRDSPDRAQLVRRLAEDYAELAAAAQRERIEAEVRLDDLRRGRGIRR